MACKPFSVQFSGNVDTLLRQLNDLIQQYHGTLEISTVRNTFSVPVQFFGPVSGYFILKPNDCTITITEHSTFLPCSVIQQFIRSEITKRAI